MTGQNDFQDNWDNWNVVEEPEERSRWLIGLVIGAVGVCLLAACGVGGYYLVWPALAPATAAPAPAVPTLPGAPETATAVAQVTGTAAAQATGTAAAIAQVTVPAPSATATDDSPPPAGETATSSPTATASPPPVAGVTAIRTASPPAIDGSLAEYGSAPAIPSAFRVYSADSWDGSADLDASWRLLWDEQNLYVGVAVEDNLHVQNQTGNQIFRGDSLDMQIDTNPGANATRVNPDTYQIILSPGNFGGLGESAFRFHGTEGGQIVDAPGHAIDVEAQQTASGYTLEAAIPWSDLGITPAEGLRLGLSLNANDNDRPGEAIQEVMMSSVSTRTLTNPQSWGTLVLE